MKTSRKKIYNIILLGLLISNIPIQPLANPSENLNIQYKKINEVNGLITINSSNFKKIQLPNGNWISDNSFDYKVLNNGTFDFVCEKKDGKFITKSITVNDLKQDILITGKREIFLELSAQDMLSGVTQMRFKENNSSWSQFETFNSKKDWILSLGDELKTISVQYKDKAGNISNEILDKIYLDQTAPIVDFSINNGSKYTNKSIVNLGFNIKDNMSDIKYIYISNNNITWQKFDNAKELEWTIDEIIGNRNIYVKAEDSSGNVSNPICKSIYFDNILPYGNIIINNGDNITNTRNIVLSLNFGDNHSGIEKVKILEGNNCYEFPNVPSSPTTLNWTLNPGVTGQVQLQIIDKAGNVYTTDSNIINIINLEITRFSLDNVVNPTVFDEANPFKPLNWDFPPQQLCAGANIEFSTFYNLYDEGALYSNVDGTYNITIEHDNGYYKSEIVSYIDKTTIGGTGLKGIYTLPIDAPKGSKVYLSSQLNATIQTPKDNVTQDAFFPGKGTKALIGSIGNNIKEGLKFNEIN